MQGQLITFSVYNRKDFLFWLLVKVGRADIAGFRLLVRFWVQLLVITLVLVELAASLDLHSSFRNRKNSWILASSLPSSLFHCTAIFSGNLPRISGMNRPSLILAVLMLCRLVTWTPITSMCSRWPAIFASDEILGKAFPLVDDAFWRLLLKRRWKMSTAFL